jgi:hypothetical protein
MEIEFSLIPEDFVAFGRHQVAQQANRRIFLYLGILLLIVVVLILRIALFVRQAGTTIGLIAAVIAISAGFIFYLNMHRIDTRAVKRQLALGKNANVLEPRRISISADGISNSSAHSAGMTMWTGVDKIAVTKDHAFIYVNTSAAIILPRRAFASDHDFTDFVETAQRYFEAANKESVLV